VTSADSLWELDSDILQPRESKAFTQTFQGYSILNNVIDVGVELPYVGLFGKSLGSYQALNGYVDASNAGSSDILALGWIDFANDKHHNIRIVDTTLLAIFSRSQLLLNAVGSIISNASGDISHNAVNINLEATNKVESKVGDNTFTLNANGVILPRIATEPTGENGAMYYSTALNKFRLYENGAWRDL
jgi:hypothetical protein